MPQKLDLTNWLTTEQVAQELGVKVRTVHHHVQSGNLHPKKFVRPGVAGGASNLFDPDEVQAFIQQRMDAKTEIIPAGDSAALVTARPTMDPVQLVEALRAQPFPIDRKRYLTLDEAVTYTGLGAGYIEQHCKGQAIGPRGRLVFKRTDLEKL